MASFSLFTQFLLPIEKKILPPLLSGLEPVTFRSWERRSTTELSPLTHMRIYMYLFFLSFLTFFYIYFYYTPKLHNMYSNIAIINHVLYSVYINVCVNLSLSLSLSHTHTHTHTHTRARAQKHPRTRARPHAHTHTHARMHVSSSLGTFHLYNVVTDQREVWGP